MTFNILVLDDEPWQLTWVEDLARAFDGTCRFTPTFDEAVAQFDLQQPDLAIVDIRIGEVSDAPKGATLEGADADWIGLRFLRFVRVERKSNIPMFVYTGLDRQRLQTIVESSFRARFFTKFESALLARALRETFKRLASRENAG